MENKTVKKWQWANWQHKSPFIKNNTDDQSLPGMNVSVLCNCFISNHFLWYGTLDPFPKSCTSPLASPMHNFKYVPTSGFVNTVRMFSINVISWWKIIRPQEMYQLEWSWQKLPVQNDIIPALESMFQSQQIWHVI